jgi:hypothetical protein
MSEDMLAEASIKQAAARTRNKLQALFMLISPHHPNDAAF